MICTKYELSLVYSSKVAWPRTNLLSKIMSFPCVIDRVFDKLPQGKHFQAYSFWLVWYDKTVFSIFKQKLYLYLLPFSDYLKCDLPLLWGVTKWRSSACSSSCSQRWCLAFHVALSAPPIGKLASPLPFSGGELLLTGCGASASTIAKVLAACLPVFRSRTIPSSSWRVGRDPLPSMVPL